MQIQPKVCKLIKTFWFLQNNPDELVKMFSDNSQRVNRSQIRNENKVPGDAAANCLGLKKHMILHSEESSVHTEQKISLESAQKFTAMQKGENSACVQSSSGVQHEIDAAK